MLNGKKIACFSLTYWANRAHADLLSGELIEWKKRVQGILLPDWLYLACGTKIDSGYNPINVPIVNAEVTYTKSHDVTYWAYSFCAETAGMWYAILNTDCDIVAQIATDCLINFDVASKLNEFATRSDLVLAPSWFGFVDDAIIFYKREAIVKFLNERRRGNLIEAKDCSIMPLLSEHEKTEIFKGRWWNPWPGIITMRQEYGISDRQPIPDDRVVSENWPIVLRPSPYIKGKYNAYSRNGL